MIRFKLIIFLFMFQLSASAQQAYVVKFTAAGDAGGISLSWATSASCDLKNFEFELRRENSDDFFSAGSYPAEAICDVELRYDHYLAAVPPGAWFIRIKVNANSGETEYSTPIRVEVLPAAGAAGVVYPNPASGPQSLEISIPHADDLTLLIADASGKTIHLSPLGPRNRGVHTISLPGLPPGLYHYFIRGKSISLEGKFISIP